MNRPSIKISLNRTDHWLEALALALLLLSWVSAFFLYPDLPEEIPIHFNLAGEADGFGSRNYIFLLPALATFIYLLLTLLNRYPQAFHYPQNSSKQNARPAFKSAMRLLRYLKVAVMMNICVDMWVSYHTSGSYASSSLSWLVMITELLILLPIAYFLLQPLLLKRSSRP